MNLSEVENQVLDVLTIHYPDWKINPDISIQIGRMHNYTAKILAQLINNGLIVSRYVTEDGKQQTYKEYRLIKEPAKMVPPCEPESKSVESMLDRCEKTLSLHQVNNPCKCGSYYMRGKNCNVCGIENDDKKECLPTFEEFEIWTRSNDWYDLRKVYNFLTGKNHK